jgi:formylglycine-generating enzyme required for sulfatase activity
VPAGTYARSNDATAPATVSAFRLDTYEVTVGRFRRFVASYAPASLAKGAGKNPNDPTDPGWDPSWSANLPVDRPALLADLKCDAAYQSWTDAPAGNETKPMSCIDWYEAFAFCVWDGGRLPTEAEWNAAAAGESDQRAYPWGAAVPGPDATLADYGCYFGGSGTCTGVANLAPAGSIPAGDGKWGHADLGGSVWEWTLDGYAPYVTPCVDCANHDPSLNRVLRGGSFYDALTYLPSSYRGGFFDPTIQSFDAGVRCARDP